MNKKVENGWKKFLPKSYLTDSNLGPRKDKYFTKLSSWKHLFSFSGNEQLVVSPSLADLEALVTAAASSLSNIFEPSTSAIEYFPQLDNIPSPKHQKCNKIMSRKAADIIASYKQALEQCGSTAYQELSQFFRQVFFAESSWNLTREMTIPLLVKMSEEFNIFAYQQRFVKANYITNINPFLTAPAF